MCFNSDFYCKLTKKFTVNLRQISISVALLLKLVCRFVGTIYIEMEASEPKCVNPNVI